MDKQEKTGSPALEDASQWPVDRKIEKSLWWDSWASFLDDTPDLAQFILERLPKDTLEEYNAAMIALWHWVRAGDTTATDSSQAEMGVHPDGAIDIMWYPGGRAALLLSGRSASTWVKMSQDEIAEMQTTGRQFLDTFNWDRAPEPSTLEDLNPKSRALALNIGRIMQAEHCWLTQGDHAPVAKAHFQGQEETDRGDIGHVDGANYEWDASGDIFNAPVPTRSGMMERDQYESDALRDTLHADPGASNWDGPYWVEAKIHPPSQELVALRQATSLGASTPRVDDTLRRPRL